MRAYYEYFYCNNELTGDEITLFGSNAVWVGNLLFEDIKFISGNFCLNSYNYNKFDDKNGVIKTLSEKRSKINGS